MSCSDHIKKNILYLFLFFIFIDFSVCALGHESDQWIENVLKKHPELLWLADNDVHYTQEGKPKGEGSYSERIFGEKFVEFDRTLLAIRCLHIFFSGSNKDYEALTVAQNPKEKLTKESFQKLHQQAKRVLQSHWRGISDEEMREAMESTLVLGDIGKSEKARQFFQPYGIQTVDHDDFYDEMIGVLQKNPSLSPSYSSLPHEGRQLLQKVAHLAHYGHIAHLEGGPEMFSRLKKSDIVAKDPTALSFDLLLHTCDVAGALGHVLQTSSLTMTETTYQILQGVEKAINELRDPKNLEEDAYHLYLVTRASWLGFDITDPRERILTRIGAMLRLTTREEGILLQQARERITPDLWDRVMAQMDGETLLSSLPTPTYMPAMLMNLSHNPTLGTTEEERLVAAVVFGLPILTSALEKYQELIKEGMIDPRIPLNFNAMAAVAKSSPESLEGEIFISDEGIVSIQHRKTVFPQ